METPEILTYLNFCAKNQKQKPDNMNSKTKKSQIISIFSPKYVFNQTFRIDGNCSIIRKRALNRQSTVF